MATNNQKWIAYVISPGMRVSNESPTVTAIFSESNDMWLLSEVSIFSQWMMADTPLVL